MTRYHVDSDAVLTATSAVRGSIGRIQSESAALHSQLASLEGSWSGPAATLFQSAVSDWRATDQRLTENLTMLNQALALAGQQYAEIESSNARLFRV